MVGFHNRFHGRNSLNELFKKGRTVRTTSCSLRYLENQRSYTRVAVVVSKKVCKSAVKRNRIRRRIFEVLRSLMPQFGTPYDLSFTVFGADIATMPAEELHKVVSGLLKSAHIMN